jgi:NADH-quinone oxidoreductase subunit M
MLGAFQYSPWVAAWAMLVVIASAVYMLWMFQRAFFAVPSDWMRRAWGGLHDLTRVEWLSLAPLVVLVVALGVFPAPVLEATAGPVQRILDAVQSAAGLNLIAWPW